LERRCRAGPGAPGSPFFWANLGHCRAWKSDWSGAGGPGLPPSLRFISSRLIGNVGAPGLAGFETREAKAITGLVCPGSHRHATLGTFARRCVVPSQVWKRARPGAPTLRSFKLDQSHENSARDPGHPPTPPTLRDTLSVAHSDLDASGGAGNNRFYDPPVSSRRVIK
jgi:hypothetical protein